MILTKLKLKLQKLDLILEELKKTQATIAKMQEGVGRLELRQLQLLKRRDIGSNEFRVFSQWGEDGLIQFLLYHVEISSRIFVEFGVQNYTESNTRFLLVNNNWAGLVIEANVEDISYIKNDSIYWQYNLKAVQSFVDKDNINTIIHENGINGEIGLLSIDIDGNDYWIWQAINVINPVIVICEYNFRFGKYRAVTVPYNQKFVRSQAHYSAIYYGASLKALCSLAARKGYVFVGCNNAGNNAFFVRKDLKPSCIKQLTAEEGFVAGQFRESRDESGKLLYLSPQEEEELLSSLPLVEVA